MKPKKTFPDSVQPGIPINPPCPPGWSTVKFRDVLFQVNRPVQLKGDSTYQLVTVKRSRGGVVKREQLKGSEIKTPTQFYIDQGDFLISKRQIVHGACGVVPPELSQAIVSNEYSVLRTRKELDTDFLAYLSHTVYFQQTCFHSSIGVHVEKMIFNLDGWLDWPINLPCLKTQQKIAEILGTWDRAIEVMEKRLEGHEARRLGLMQRLLTDNGTRLGLQTQWQNYELGELFTERKDIGFSHLPLASITREQGVIPRGDVDRKDTSSADKSKYLRICPGDIGYNTMRMWQGVSGLSELEAIVSPAYTICIPNEQINGRFASYLFKLPTTIRTFEKYSQGLTSDTWNLKFPVFAKIAVRIPGLTEQTRIAEILSTADAEIENLRRQLSALRQQKKGLMQKLLTGKIIPS